MDSPWLPAWEGGGGGGGRGGGGRGGKVLNVCLRVTPTAAGENFRREKIKLND